MAGKLIRQLRDFPSVEEVLQSKELAPRVETIPRPVAAEVVKAAIADLKEKFRSSKEPVPLKEVTRQVVRGIESIKKSEISRVINATGVVVHTNLGRAPLSSSLFDAVKGTVTGYGNIEFDLETGKRGERGRACEKYLAMLSEAESATVVNNCAAALLITLNTFANRKKVVISRGELVQIGGGFRIPDILKKSGARLCEVGTTNITTLADYESNIDDKTALILRVHQSNFVQMGFTEQVSLKALVELGKKRGVPIVNDLGSGVFIGTREILGYSEPTVQHSVRSGTDLTCFSGDKMLGGCQAGLIVGKADMVGKIKRNALFRTVRVDKIVFAVLERLLASYLDGNAVAETRLWSLLSVSEPELYRRAKRLLKALGNPQGVSIEATVAFVGGGALPQAGIPSVGLVFSSSLSTTRLLKRLREMPVPVIGRIDEDRLILDLKAVDHADLPLLEKAIRKVLA